MTSVTAHPTVLAQGQRFTLASDQTFGGGSVLRAALAANPSPDVPFLFPEIPLVDTDGRELSQISLAQLDRLAQGWSVWYLSQGVRPRDRVAIYLDDTFAYPLHFFALSQIGAIPVMVNSRAPHVIATSLCQQTTPVGLYTNRARLRQLGNEVLAAPTLRWVETVEDVPAPPGAWLPDDERYHHTPDDPVSILHSSGTTGRPKPVVQTHASSVAGPRFRMLSHTELPGALMMTALPQSHLGNIAYSTYAVLAGTPLVPLFDPTGADLAAAVAKHQPTSVMAFAHAYGELAAIDLPKGAMDSVNVWVAMGDAIHEAHLRRILGQRSPHLPTPSFFDRLGTTELGWGALLHIHTEDSGRKQRCVGRPTGVSEVTVLRQDGSEAAVGEFGFLGAKGPAITAGYWDDADTTYRSKLAGYWLTGDIAYRDDIGQFFQVDRTVDAVVTPDGTGYSVLMEEILLNQLTDVSDCAVVAGGWRGSVVPVAVVRTASETVDPASLLAQANQALTATGQPHLAFLEVAYTEEVFPLGVTGKVLKRALRERYADLHDYLSGDADRVLAVNASLTPALVLASGGTES